MTDTPKRKRGRPRLNKPPKLSQRPKAIPGSFLVRASFGTDDLIRLDTLAASAGLSRSAMLRKLVEDASNDRQITSATARHA